MNAASCKGPLDGLLVADLSRVLAGPSATMLLGDLGADVVKVESPAGDDTRLWGPPYRDGITTYYLGLNRNKKSIILDLGESGDQALALSLVRRADIVIENFLPGRIQKFGLDYTSVRAINPGVIYCSISGFGSTGGANLPGYDLVAQAASGLMSLTGPIEGPPYRAGMAVFDVVTGLHATIGILAALRHRMLTGEGQNVEVNLLSSALFSLANHASAFAAGGVVPPRVGNAMMSLYPYEPMATAEGDLVVIAANDAQFLKLAEVLGAPHLASDPRFATVAERNINRDILRPLLLERLALRSAREWHVLLSNAGVPAGPVNDVREGFEMAEALGLEPIVDTGGIPGVRNPISFSSTTPTYRLPPPALGANGDEIRAWLRDEEPFSER